MPESYDVAIIGGGHNALVAAAYLARAGRSVLVLERAESVGGAAVSKRIFPGIDARLSRFSYLVSLLPDQIVSDLGLNLRLRSRAVASYTPVADGGLLVERTPGPLTEESFRTLTGSDAEYARWRGFYGELATVAQRLAPTMLSRLPSADEARDLIGDDAWQRFVEQPLGKVIEQTFADDIVRGVVLTDGLIGTFTHAHDPSLLQNRCFLYHLIGNGTGEWRVPVGGMGAVTAEIARAASTSGATIRTSSEVVGLDADGRRAEITYLHSGGEHRVTSSYVLSGVAPATLEVLLGDAPTRIPEGAQTKVNLLVTRLPRLRSGIDPGQAFAGTFHLGEGYTELQTAYDEAADGRFPSGAPAELYCHTLTDPSILEPGLAAQGWHTLTLFGLHTPPRVFAPSRGAEARTGAISVYLALLNAHLAEPIEDCLAVDSAGRPCVEAMTPLDVEAEVGMPGGHIFHGDLAWPWLESEPSTTARAWGVETGVANVFLCGSGARRGGGVSGIAGHNAAHAVLDTEGVGVRHQGLEPRTR